MLEIHVDIRKVTFHFPMNVDMKRANCIQLYINSSNTLNEFRLKALFQFIHMQEHSTGFLRACATVASFSL